MISIHIGVWNIYMWIEKSDKKMFEKIATRVQEGRWNIVGGWFIQPNCNLPSEELFEAEEYSLLSKILVDTEYPLEEYKRAWEDVLFIS